MAGNENVRLYKESSAEGNRRYKAALGWSISDNAENNMPQVGNDVFESSWFSR